MSAYDVIVVGLGAMGGAAAYHAARRGARVLGLDGNPPGHALGSSHGQTRAIRETYFEAPDYVPLVQRAYDLWAELEAEAGEPLLTESGALYLAPAGHPMLAGVSRAAADHGLATESLSQKDTAARFPGFTLPAGWRAIHERRGGILQAERCLAAHLDLARRHGAEFRFDAPATAWRPCGDGIEVSTPKGRFTAGRVVLTLGPWAPTALAGLSLPLSGRRITVVHLAPAAPDAFDAATYSVFFLAGPEGVFAGFPYLPGEGVKIMRHDTGDVCTPETVRRAVSAADVAEVTDFVARTMPRALGRVMGAHVCLYTMTPDTHFIVDHHPALDGVTYATGFSGHGFKFAPVIGEALADLALDGATRLPI